MSDFSYLFQPIWEKDTDDLLQSILTGSSSATGEVGGHLDGPFSDTSSDSGVNLEQQLLSPSSMTLGGMEDPMAAASPKMVEVNGCDVNVNGINNLIDFISQGELGKPVLENGLEPVFLLSLCGRFHQATCFLSP